MTVAFGHIETILRESAMKCFTFAILIAGAWLASVASMGRAADPAKDELQGVWVAASGETNGKPVPAKEVERTRFTFKGEKLLIRGFKDDMSELGCSYKIRTEKAPKQIDVLQGKTVLVAGIYEVKGDRLQVCWGSNEKNRPTKFATNKEEELTLIVFKRQKP